MRALNLAELSQIAGGQQPVLQAQTHHPRPHAESFFGQIQQSLANNRELKEMFSEEAFPVLAGIFVAGILTGVLLVAAFSDEEEPSCRL